MGGMIRNPQPLQGDPEFEREDIPRSEPTYSTMGGSALSGNYDMGESYDHLNNLYPEPGLR